MGEDSLGSSIGKVPEQRSFISSKRIANLKPMSVTRNLTHRNRSTIAACLSAPREKTSWRRTISCDRHYLLPIQTNTHTHTSTIYTGNDEYFSSFPSAKLYRHLTLSEPMGYKGNVPETSKINFLPWWEEIDEEKLPSFCHWVWLYKDVISRANTLCEH